MLSEGIGRAGPMLYGEGPYDTIDEAYAVMGAWIAENGLHVAGPPQEAYLRPPADKLDPLTEIRFPVTRS